MDVNKLITVAAIIGGFAQLFFIYNFFNSIFRGKKAAQNPWQSNTLEWSAPVEHLHGNWPGEIPTVYRGPYEYSRPDRDEDFYPQYLPGEGDSDAHHAAKPVEPTEVNSPSETVEHSVFFAAVKRVFGLG